MGFLLITVVVIFIFGRSYYYCVSFICELNFFCFVLLSNFFFARSISSSLLSPPPLFFTNWEWMKNLNKEKIGCIFVLCSRCTTQKVNVGVENVFLNFFTKANNKKNRLMSRDFQKINTLYLKFFSIQDISCTRQITPLVKQFFLKFYFWHVLAMEDVFFPFKC